MTEKEVTMEELEQTHPETIETNFLAFHGFTVRVLGPSCCTEKSKEQSVKSEQGPVPGTTDPGVGLRVKRTDEQLDLMEWKMDNVEKELVEPLNTQDMCVMNLLKSVSEVRSDYQQLRRELVEVQALQRELSSKLRAQLRLVHGKFARLRQRIAAASPPR